MRAIAYDRYGSVDVLEVREQAQPTAGPGQVLVRVKAAGLNPKDSFVRKGRFKRFTGAVFPRGVGYDFSGVADGAEVYGMINGWSGRTVAQFVVVDADELAPKPASLSFTDAAAVPLAAMTALQALRDEAELKAGQSVLIHGASGGVGTFAIQLAKHFGARVTTTSSPANFELCRTLGASTTLDYKDMRALASAGPFDVFFDVFGNSSLRKSAAWLATRAVYVSTVPSATNVFQHLVTRFFKRRTRLVQVRSNRADLALLTRIIDAGGLKPMVERVFSLEQTGEAQAHIETKRTRGKVVIAVE